MNRDRRAIADKRQTPMPVDAIWQVADILATGYLRLRMRQAQRAIATFSEKRLDDVGHSAMFGTGETRTSEKGETAHEW